MEEISDVKGYSAKINKIGGADYTVHSSDFDHTYYKDGYFIYGYYFNINNYEWSLLGNLLGDISRYMCDLIYGEYYEELLFNIGRNPYSCADNTKEYGFKNYRDALEQLGYFDKEEKVNWWFSQILKRGESNNNGLSQGDIKQKGAEKKWIYICREQIWEII